MTASIEPSNPAARIFVVLETVKGIHGGTIRSAYTKALQIENEDLGQLLKMLGMLSDQCDDVEVLLANVANPTYSEKYRESQQGIKRCFEIENIAGPWDTFQANFVRPELLMALTFCAIALDERHRERTLPAEDLQKWLANVTKLYDKAKKADLDYELKTLILNSLDRIRNAILDYRIRGIRAVREAIMETVGSVSENLDRKIAEEVKRENADPESPKIVVEWVSFAADIAQIITLGMMLSPLFTQAVRSLLPGN